MGQLDMSIYLKHMKIRYRRGGRKEKSRILDEYCKTSGQHRKHVIRMLRDREMGTRRSTGRKKTYMPSEVIEPLKTIWLATDQMCSKRLKVAIGSWLPYYTKHYGELSDSIKGHLKSMSAATIDRLIQPLRSKHTKRFCGTKPGTLLKKQIPVLTEQWETNKPGFVEADTVAHCGESLLGDFVWSLTLTDIFSGWTENRATWNKGAAGVMTQIESIEKALPFEILGFDSDNGNEFLNHHLLSYFHDRTKKVQFTRSRPYKKNDNAHVEQKNWTHVRQVFGYYRFSDARLVMLMNDLYSKEMSLLTNYFYPCIKLIDKKRIQSKIKKIHDKPKTPYQRLMDCEDISQAQKIKLKEIFESLDPFFLKKQIQLKLRRIFNLVNVKVTSKKKTG